MLPRHRMRPREEGRARELRNQGRRLGGRSFATVDSRRRRVERRVRARRRLDCFDLKQEARYVGSG